VSITWNAIQAVNAPEPTDHLSRAEALGLVCPPDVFEQLFYDHHNDGAMAQLLRFVDWSKVSWREEVLSGVALRHSAVPRAWQQAVDEARQATTASGFQDERPDVTTHWEEHHTWIRRPILLRGKILQSSVRYELIVGFTRLGNLLGSLDRQDLPEHARHEVWVGS
jgi:hypothetical protein